jgi:preprotein translocase subunit SecG
MPVDRPEVRLSITKLLLALIIIIVPLSIIGLILAERSDKALDASIGTNFKTMARMYSNDVSQTILDRVAAVRALASDPVIASAASGTRNTSSKVSAAGAGILATSASELLHQRRLLDPRYLSIVVTDDSGNVVAASQQPPKQSFAQDANWQSAYNNGQGTVKISDIVEEPFRKAEYVNIDVPILDPGSGSTFGILSAAVDITDLLARFRQEQIGNGAIAELVNDDGSIVSAPNADVFARAKSQEFDALRDQLGLLKTSSTGWQIASVRDTAYLVGFAGTGLKQHFNNLGWIVLVSQDEHQAAASVRGLIWFARIMVIFGVLMLTLMCVYYFLHRTERFEDIEEALPHDRTRAPTSRGASA